MNEICGDNRFEIIAKAKAHLLDATNIDTSEDEMKVLDSFLFRCWQMGWLDRYAEQTEPMIYPQVDGITPSVIEPKSGKWIYGEHDVAMCDGYRCDRCGFFVPWDYEHKSIDFINDYHFCPYCGAKMDGERKESE